MQLFGHSTNICGKIIKVVKLITQCIDSVPGMWKALYPLFYLILQQPVNYIIILQVRKL